MCHGFQVDEYVHILVSETRYLLNVQKLEVKLSTRKGIYANTRSARE